MILIVLKYLQRGHTPLHQTSGRGLVKTVEALIKAGVDVNIADKVSYVMLYIYNSAYRYTTIDIIKYTMKCNITVMYM